MRTKDTSKQTIRKIKAIIAKDDTDTIAIAKALDLADYNIEELGTYRYMSGNDTKFAIKLIDGHWVDVTDLVQAQEALTQAKKELIKEISNNIALAKQQIDTETTDT